MSEYTKLIKQAGDAVNKSLALQVGLVADQMMQLKVLRERMQRNELNLKKQLPDLMMQIKILRERMQRDELNLQKQLRDLMIFASECGHDATTIETDVATFSIDETGSLNVKWEPMQ